MLSIASCRLLAQSHFTRWQNLKASHFIESVSWQFMRHIIHHLEVRLYPVTPTCILKYFYIKYTGVNNGITGDEDIVDRCSSLKAPCLQHTNPVFNQHMADAKELTKREETLCVHIIQDHLVCLGLKGWALIYVFMGLWTVNFLMNIYAQSPHHSELDWGFV